VTGEGREKRHADPVITSGGKKTKGGRLWLDSRIGAVCDMAEDGMAEKYTQDLASHWQQVSFHLESDVWVITNGRNADRSLRNGHATVEEEETDLRLMKGNPLLP
jgi:hypothetical protein